MTNFFGDEDDDTYPLEDKLQTARPINMLYTWTLFLLN